MGLRHIWHHDRWDIPLARKRLHQSVLFRLLVSLSFHTYINVYAIYLKHGLVISSTVKSINDRRFRHRSDFNIFSPSAMNIGNIKSDGLKVVSRTKERIDSLVQSSTSVIGNILFDFGLMNFDFRFIPQDDYKLSIINLIYTFN
jgi:hypothetical protein